MGMQTLQRGRLLWRQLWADQSGVVLSTEVVLLGTVLGAGTLVGMAQLRDTVIGEMSDLSQVLSDLNQSYSLSGLESCSARTAGSRSGDFAEEDDAADPTSACISVEISSPDSPRLPGELET